jgi:hypothetical protein
MNEDRILDKLDTIEARGVETLVAVTQLQEQVKDVPDLMAAIEDPNEEWSVSAA